MVRTHFVKLSVNAILTLKDLGLDRSAGLDEASCGLARISEAQIVRWVQFPADALFFTLAPGDPESGGVESGAPSSTGCTSEAATRDEGRAASGVVSEIPYIAHRPSWRVHADRLPRGSWRF